MLQIIIIEFDGYSVNAYVFKIIMFLEIFKIIIIMETIYVFCLNNHGN